MKWRALSAILTLAIASVATAPASAQSTDPCSVYTCMAGISGAGGSGGPACTPALDNFFGSLVVYDEMGFDPFATAALREGYMESCPGTDLLSNTAVLYTIVDLYFDVP